jgi:hypothetical protein
VDLVCCHLDRNRKGHSFIGYFIFSLFFFPAAIIVAYLVQDRTEVPGAAMTAVS